MNQFPPSALRYGSYRDLELTEREGESVWWFWMVVIGGLALFVSV